MAKPIMNTAPPKCCTALLELVVTSRKTGNSVLTNSTRRFFKNTTKSARSNEVRMSGIGGPVAGRELVTDLAPRQADEDVLQGDFAVGDLANPRILLVLFDQVVRRFGRQQRAVVDYRDSITDRLGLLHRVGGQEDAPALLSEVLDADPELPTRLRI